MSDATNHKSIRASATSRKGAEETDLWDDTCWIVQYVKPYWKMLLLLVVLLIVSSASKNGMAYVFQPLLDDVFANKNINELQNISLIILGLTIVLTVSSYFQRTSARWVKEKVMVDLRMDVFSKLLELPIGFYSKQKKGDLISRVTNDIQVTRLAVHDMITRLFKEPFMALGALGVCLYASWQLTLISFIVIPIVVITFRKFGERIKKSKKESLLELSDVVESLNQILSGMRVVKIFQGEEKEKEEFGKTNERLLTQNMNVIRNKALSNSFLVLLRGVLIAGFIFGGAWLVISSQSPLSLTSGKLVMFLSGLGLLYQPLRKVTKGYNRLQEARAAIHRLRELLDRDGRLEGEGIQAGDKPLDTINDNIRLKNITFAYDDEPVLKEIDLTINANEMIALVGPSGAGKSTLMDLIARFYGPDDGRIEIDGVPLSEFERSEYLKHLSIVSQDSFLFNTSIEENIRYGDSSSSDEAVREAARAAYIHEFINSLPEGYDTNVGERGVRVSGGEKQRITIARALLKDADLLLLDEATSELDSHSEEIVQKALNRLIKDRTCIVIAHRLSTVRSADRIVVLEEGRIVQKGTHEELLSQDGLYKQLHELQFKPVGSSG